jgi:hypothetical protein
MQNKITVEITRLNAVPVIVVPANNNSEFSVVECGEEFYRKEIETKIPRIWKHINREQSYVIVSERHMLSVYFKVPLKTNAKCLPLVLAQPVYCFFNDLARTCDLQATITTAHCKFLLVAYFVGDNCHKNGKLPTTILSEAEEKLLLAQQKSSPSINEKER